MKEMELVTGRAGSPHITSQHERQKNQGLFGTDAYILQTGNELEASVQSSNTIQIKDGALMFQGALFSVPVGTVDSVTIANGTQGMQRKDFIVVRYTYDSSENIESGEWAVRQGTPAESYPNYPTYTNGDIQNGDSVVEHPVFAVTIDGINIESVEKWIDPLPSVEDMNRIESEHVFENRFSTGIVSRNGKVKRLHLEDAAVNFTAGTQYTLGSMPINFIPKTATVREFVIISASTSSTVTGRITISLDGIVTFTPYGERNSGERINIDITYI